jgi:hypothetical protein
VRDQLRALEAAAVEAKLEMPTQPRQHVEAWDFDEATTLLTEGQAAVDAYLTARVVVDDERSLWQRLGLLGRDAGEALEDAEEAFQAGEFRASAEHSGDAEDMIDGARGAATSRVLVVLGVLLGLSVLVAGGVCFLGRRGPTGARTP